MLVLTRTRRWGELPALETQYSDMLEQLKAIKSLQALNVEQLMQRCCVLHVINSNQCKISSLIQPQLDLLGISLRNLELQQHLDLKVAEILTARAQQLASNIFF